MPGLIKMVFILIILPVLVNAKDASMQEDKWNWRDLVSKYSRTISEERLADPEGEKFKVKYRFQSSVDISPIIGPDISFGRQGSTVIKCIDNCDFPKLMIRIHYHLIVLNRWHGVWYYVAKRFMSEGPLYLFGKAEKERWIPISAKEFPPQLAITNMNYELDDEKYMTRDSTRKEFSTSKPWLRQKGLWYFLKYEKSYEYQYNKPDPLPDSEAFPFFLKYIKPHWKFDNPVLDMDFSPYEGIDPGMIPFPNEIRKAPGTHP